MTDNSFFDETSEQSLVKMTIVSKYFWAWAKVLIPTVKKHGGKLAYLDLFSGPGRYKDGTKSTPIRVLEKAIEEPDFCEMLIAMFNDRDDVNVQSLQSAIDVLPGIEKLRYRPVVKHNEVGSEMVKMFEKMRLVPTFFFVDPWGYKGLSLKLVNAVLKDWGCDCVFFFNYNRVNMGLGNAYVEEHMDALFGKQRAQELRPRLESLSTVDRELAIIEELCNALGASSGRYVLPFRFRNAHGNRTSHHLIFVSKHFRGYEIMKGIMAKESSCHDQGVPSLEYNPADRKYRLLFELSRPLDDLEAILLSDFAGRTATVKEVYENHNVGRQYIKKNYKDVLTKMEADGQIVADPPAAKRRCQNGVVTFADSVRVTFKSRGR
jgi:three-Cys-motif partner protein